MAAQNEGGQSLLSLVRITIAPPEPHYCGAFRAARCQVPFPTILFVSKPEL